MIRKLLLLSVLAQMDISAQTFTLVEGHGIIPVQFSDVHFADIDNDGDQDLFTLGGSPNTPTCRLYKNDGNGLFTLHDSSTFIQKRDGAAAFGDVNGDGAPDLLISGTSAGVGVETELYLNNGNGDFALAPESDFLGVTQGDVAIMDTDNDGDNDIIIAGMNSSSTYIFSLYVNNGQGAFTRNMGSGLEAYGMTLVSFAIADLNADGFIDIVTSSKTGLSATSMGIRLFLNQGNGTFEYAPTPNITALLGKVALSDTDNDGDLDLLIAGNGASTGGNPANGFRMELYENDGDAHFTVVADLPFVGMGDKLSMAFADVNNDGYDDLLAMGRNYSATIAGNNVITANLYLNNGEAGGFTFVEGTPFTGHSNGTISFADVDGDDDADVLITGINNGTSAVAKLYRNDGQLGVADNHTSAPVVYPNPAASSITINPGQQHISSIEIRTMNGQTALSPILSTGPLETIDLSSLATGIYLLTIETENGSVHHQKIIKKVD